MAIARGLGPANSGGGVVGVDPRSEVDEAKGEIVRRRTERALHPLRAPVSDHRGEATAVGGHLQPAPIYARVWVILVGLPLRNN